MKTSKVLLCSSYPGYGVSDGRENRLDVTNPHTEKFFKKLKNRSAVGVWYRLVRAEYDKVPAKVRKAVTPYKGLGFRHVFVWTRCT